MLESQRLVSGVRQQQPASLATHPSHAHPPAAWTALPPPPPPQPRWNCAQAGAFWTAYQVANGALNVARGFLNEVATGVAKAAFDTAKGTLAGYQKAATDVLRGTQFVARETAQGVLTAAQLRRAPRAHETGARSLLLLAFMHTLSCCGTHTPPGCQQVQAADSKPSTLRPQATATGVLKGTQAAALGAAKEALTGAQKAADAVLTGTEFTTLQTANGVLQGALYTVKGAEASVSGTLDALNKGLSAIGDALSRVKTSGFLQLNGLGLQLTARTSRFAVGFSYDAVVAGNRLQGSLSASLSDPEAAIADFLRDKALGAVRDAFPMIAPYLG
jgi:hypothetical protein